MVPDRVVVSPAQRARQTWELAAAEIVDAPSPIVDARVYDNTVEALLAVIRETPVAVGVLTLVGHNPSVQELAGYLDAGRGESIPRDQMMTKYPTSGVAVIDLTGPWAQAQADAGTLVAFAAPRG
jgi:phosphohistidine phosphatase